MNWTTKNCFGKTFASGIQRQIDRFRWEAFSEHFENFQWKTMRQITAIRTMNLGSMWTMWWGEQMVCIWLAFVCKKHRNNKKNIKISPWKFSEEKSKKKTFEALLCTSNESFIAIQTISMGLKCMQSSIAFQMNGANWNQPLIHCGNAG